jgi:hypothetical protein
VLVNPVVFQALFCVICEICGELTNFAAYSS